MFAFLAIVACQAPTATDGSLVADPDIVRLVGAPGEEVSAIVRLANLGDGPVRLQDIRLAGAPEWVSLGDVPVEILPSGVVEVPIAAHLPEDIVVIGAELVVTGTLEVEVGGCSDEVIVEPVGLTVPIEGSVDGAPTDCAAIDADCDGVDDDCDGSIDEDYAGADWYADADGDGWGGASGSGCPPADAVDVGGDCDDGDPTVNPGAAELCNAVDDDCDGLVDGDDPDLDAIDWYADLDQDGFGDPDAYLGSDCAPLPYGVPDGTDCDDTRPEVNPAADEVCNLQDDDCDGLIDEDAVDALTLYTDADGDGFGDSAAAVEACAPTDGLVETAGDCDDGDATTYLGAPELCDGRDNDCDGIVDDDTVDVSWYADADGDGLGDPDDALSSCAPVPGRVTNAGDCDDGDASVSDGDLWAPDADADGFGDDGRAETRCAPPDPTWTVVLGDCDDGAADVYPGAPEVCDAVDQDCDGLVDEDAPGTVGYRDLDGDGAGDAAFPLERCALPPGYVATPDDCDDGDATAFPGAAEVCDGDDEDCDGLVDEEGALGSVPSYADTDGDGFGDPAAEALTCGLPAGSVADGTDCDDADILTFPGATEICDTRDNDCNGRIDDYAVGDATWTLDADGDGFGDGSTAVVACAPPGPDWTTDPRADCDDADPTINPAAAEICDGVDQDCDGAIDEDAVAAARWFQDGDGDGFGDPASFLEDCVQPPGFVRDGSDCDDADPGVFPGAPEVCDGVDQDCDGAIDEDAVDPLTFFVDADSDGFGDLPAARCQIEEGLAERDGDCDDTDPGVFPGADEVCDGVDQDCDGAIDEDAVDAPTWFADVDGDTFGDPLGTVASCEVPDGFVADDTDCDDTDPGVFPGADEVCDGVDQDCDGAIDEGAVDAPAWFADVDGDTFGDPGTTLQACGRPPGFVADASDCDDGDPSAFPGAPEVCDGDDDDCDGEVDEAGAIGEGSWFFDEDGDGFGNVADVAQACTAPPRRVADATDCDDEDPSVFPGATEICDGIDQDCDGTADEDAADATVGYDDLDGDGFGDPRTGLASCETIPGLVEDASDCDDADPLTNPLAPEICDGRDNDCDAIVDDAPVDGALFYTDVDGDGFGAADAPVLACALEGGLSEDDTDCDDLRADIFPGADEFCDGVDNDCDAQVDEDDAVDALAWYADTDGDGFGNAGVRADACEAPPGFIGDDSDCNDADRNVYPGAPEVCGDLRDNDCDGTIDDPQRWWQDNDSDGFGNPLVQTLSCFAPYGYVGNGDDCLDTRNTVYPGAPELCDGLDNDCNGAVDDDPIDEITWYSDGDADGFGGDASAQTGCVQPPGTTLVGGDCNDADNGIYPGRAETCDTVDQDCDGSIDEGTGTCLCPIVQYDGHAYAFCTIFASTWGLADLGCDLFGYDLVSINDAAEQAFLAATAPAFGSTDWFIGLDDQAVEGRYDWDDNSGSTYRNWDVGQPSAGFGEDCIEIDGSDFLWNDTSCFITFNNYICESP